MVRRSRADEARLRSAIIDLLRTSFGTDDVVAEDINLGGKDVVALKVAGELQGYLYIDGDIAHTLRRMSEATAAPVLEALP